MPQLAVWNSQGEKVGNEEVDAAVFGVPLNRDLLHQAVLVIDSQRQRKMGRAQRRDQVDRTTAKMYRQKGLGRARHGDRAAPSFVGGGVAHPPNGAGRIRVMPKRARQLAMYTALSTLAKRGHIVLLEELALSEPKTSVMAALLEQMKLQGKIILLASREEAKSEANFKSCRNLPRLVLRESPHINTRDVLWADYIVLTRAGLAALVGGGTEDA